MVSCSFITVMLPFTPIAFVKKKCTKITAQDKTEVTKDLEPQDNLFLSDSAKFYKQVVSEPSVKKISPKILSKANKRDFPQPITPKLFSELYTNVCNDDVGEVKAWFDKYLLLDNQCIKKYDETQLEALTDCHGCNIAMAAVVSKSYHSLNFILLSIPSVFKLIDSYGHSFYDIIKSVDDEKIYQIVKTVKKTIFSNSYKNDIKNSIRDSSLKQFCEICQEEYSTFDHESSIGHLVAENRAVLEINPHIDSSSIGYKMMEKCGWTESKGLGKFYL